MSFRTLRFGDRTISYDAGLNLVQNEGKTDLLFMTWNGCVRLYYTCSFTVNYYMSKRPLFKLPFNIDLTTDSIYLSKERKTKTVLYIHSKCSVVATTLLIPTNIVFYSKKNPSKNPPVIVHADVDEDMTNSKHFFRYFQPSLDSLECF